MVTIVTASPPHRAAATPPRPIDIDKAPPARSPHVAHQHHILKAQCPSFADTFYLCGRFYSQANTMDSLVSLFGRLNGVLASTGDWRLKPPMICAIGVQSSGKSSVIDALIGLDILPRNTGELRRGGELKGPEPLAARPPPSPPLFRFLCRFVHTVPS